MNNLEQVPEPVAYRVIIIGIRTYLGSGDTDDLLRLVESLRFHNERFQDILFYRDLIMMFIIGQYNEFIDKQLSSLDLGTSILDNISSQDLQDLQEHKDTEVEFWESIILQLTSLAYVDLNTAHDEKINKETQKFMLGKKLAFQISIYKYRGVLHRQTYTVAHPHKISDNEDCLDRLVEKQIIF